MKRLTVSIGRQSAVLLDGDAVLATYRISTAANGAGCVAGSNCTPTGRLRVAEKIGHGLPPRAILESRVPTGSIWHGGSEDRDLILTRILWLEGLEPENANSKDRYIYLHGTNREDLLGTPASHGCVRFSNTDIAALFDLMDEGDEVFITD